MSYGCRARRDVSLLSWRLNKPTDTAWAPELATWCKAAFLAPGWDGPRSKPARMAAASPLARSFCKSLEKFQYRPEINTDSEQARPVTAHFIGCGNEDQFVLITSEKRTASNKFLCWRYLSLFFFPSVLYLHILLKKKKTYFLREPDPTLTWKKPIFCFLAMPSHSDRSRLS